MIKSNAPKYYVIGPQILDSHRYPIKGTHIILECKVKEALELIKKRKVTCAKTTENNIEKYLLIQKKVPIGTSRSTFYDSKCSADMLENSFITYKTSKDTISFEQSAVFK